VFVHNLYVRGCKPPKNGAIRAINLVGLVGLVGLVELHRRY